MYADYAITALTFLTAILFWISATLPRRPKKDEEILKEEEGQE